MSSVVFLESYSHMEIDDKTPRLAHSFRTYLKGWFALRGHAHGDIVSVYLPTFTKSISSIKVTGYGAAPSRTKKGTTSAGNNSTKESWPKVLMAYSSSTSSGDYGSSSVSPSLSPDSFTPDMPQDSRRTLRQDTTVLTQACEDSSCDVISTPCIRPQWNAVNNQADEPRAPLTGTILTPGIAPKVVSRQFVISDTSSDSESPITSPKSLSPDKPVETIKTESVSSPLSSQFRACRSPPALGSSVAVPGSAYTQVEDLGSDSDTDSVLGDEGSTNSSTGRETHSPENIEYEIPEGRTECVESWVNTMMAITTTVKISESHLMTLRACETSMTSIQARIQAASASAKIEEAQIVNAYQAISSSLSCDSVEDPVSYLEAQQAAISDAKTKITAIKKAYDDKRTDLEAQIANVTNDKVTADVKMQEVNIDVANAKKRKAEIEEKGGFALGFMLGRTLRGLSEESRSKKKVKL